MEFSQKSKSKASEMTKNADFTSENFQIWFHVKSEWRKIANLPAHNCTFEMIDWIKKAKATSTTWCHYILLDKKRNEKWEDRYSSRFWNGFTFTSFSSSSSTFSRFEEERGSQIDEPFIGLPPYVLSSFWGNVISDLEWSREMMSATYHLPENLNSHIFTKFCT